MTTSHDRWLNLFFPQWQGAGQPEIYTGALQLRSALGPDIAFSTVPMAHSYSLARAENILGYQQIATQLHGACTLIQTANPTGIFTLGGDCGVELAPVSWLNHIYDGLAVVWLDAHADLNTPTSSPSGHFHGMPLRALLGQGDGELQTQLFSILQPQQVILAGSRAYDPPEQEFLQQHSISTISAAALNAGQYNSLGAALTAGGFKQIYIHFDLDVLDPASFPHVACPTSGGLSVNSAQAVLDYLVCHFQVVGCSLLEFMPVSLNPELRPVLEFITALGCGSELPSQL